MRRGRRAEYSVSALPTMRGPLWLAALVALCGGLLFQLHQHTGIFSRAAIDARDLAHWQYRSDGLIEGAQPFVFEGGRERCWLLLHGYASSPQAMRALGEWLSAQTGQHIEAPLLAGHGRQPGELLGLDIEDWFAQALARSEELLASCQSLNLVGSSFGATISVGLGYHYRAEQRLRTIYLMNPYFRAPSIHGIKAEWLLQRLGSLLHYEKTSVAALHYPGDSLPRIRYLNFPWQPVADSLDWIHNAIAPERLRAIHARVFAAHAEGDGTASFAAAAGVMQFRGEQQWLQLPGSDHVVLLSQQRHQVLPALLAFELRGAVGEGAR